MASEDDSTNPSKRVEEAEKKEKRTSEATASTFALKVISKDGSGVDFSSQRPSSSSTTLTPSTVTPSDVYYRV